MCFVVRASVRHSHKSERSTLFSSACCFGYGKRAASDPATPGVTRMWKGTSTSMAGVLMSFALILILQPQSVPATHPHMHWHHHVNPREHHHEYHDYTHPQPPAEEDILSLFRRPSDSDDKDMIDRLTSIISRGRQSDPEWVNRRYKAVNDGTLLHETALAGDIHKMQLLFSLNPDTIDFDLQDSNNDTVLDICLHKKDAHYLAEFVDAVLKHVTLKKLKALAADKPSASLKLSDVTADLFLRARDTSRAAVKTIFGNADLQARFTKFVQHYGHALHQLGDQAASVAAALATEVNKKTRLVLNSLAHAITHGVPEALRSIAHEMEH